MNQRNGTLLVEIDSNRGRQVDDAFAERAVEPSSP